MEKYRNYWRQWKWKCFKRAQNSSLVQSALILTWPAIVCCSCTPGKVSVTVCLIHPTHWEAFQICCLRNVLWCFQGYQTGSLGHESFSVQRSWLIEPWRPPLDVRHVRRTPWQQVAREKALFVVHRRPFYSPCAVLSYETQLLKKSSSWVLYLKTIVDSRYGGKLIDEHSRKTQIQEIHKIWFCVNFCRRDLINLPVKLLHSRVWWDFVAKLLLVRIPPPNLLRNWLRCTASRANGNLTPYWSRKAIKLTI